MKSAQPAAGSRPDELPAAAGPEEPRARLNAQCRRCRSAQSDASRSTFKALAIMAVNASVPCNFMDFFSTANGSTVPVGEKLKKNFFSMGLTAETSGCPKYSRAWSVSPENAIGWERPSYFSPQNDRICSSIAFQLHF